MGCRVGQDESSMSPACTQCSSVNATGTLPVLSRYRAQNAANSLWNAAFLNSPLISTQIPLSMLHLYLLSYPQTQQLPHQQFSPALLKSLHPQKPRCITGMNRRKIVCPFLSPLSTHINLRHRYSDYCSRRV
jgi:hypothetical protein